MLYFAPRWYDLWDDWELIEASFADQYHIRLRSDAEFEMTWDEFKNLLAGLGPDTALGRVISIRSEESDDTLKYFSDGQKQIRNDWQKAERQRKKEFDKKNKRKAVDPYEGLSNMFRGLSV